jgi:membrane protein DedA with SNARE-associated domain
LSHPFVIARTAVEQATPGNLAECALARTLTCLSEPRDGWIRMRELVRSFLEWYLGALDAGGYPLITFLMALESSLVPLPSEVVIPPAAHVAYTRGTMSLTGIVVAGTIGSWLGATAMYWAARLLGRPLLMRYGRYVMITPEKIEQAETWSATFGTVGIFISRLLPVIRHLIGIPAGIVRMDYLRFSAATIVGSAIWCTVLAWVGVTMGQDQELMAGNLHRISMWVGGLMLFLGALYYFFVHRHMRR